MTIDKNTIIGDIINVDMGAGQVLQSMGMHCFMCPSAQGETLEEAAQVHNIDCDELVARLKEYFGLA